MKYWQSLALTTFCALSYATAHASGTAFFIKHAGAGCEKKGVVEGTFGKEIYTDWSIWSPVYILNQAQAMDSMLKKAQELGANRVVIERIDGEYVKSTSTTPGDYGPHSTTSLLSAIVRGVAYVCK